MMMSNICKIGGVSTSISSGSTRGGRVGGGGGGSGGGSSGGNNARVISLEARLINTSKSYIPIIKILRPFKKKSSKDCHNSRIGVVNIVDYSWDMLIDAIPFNNNNNINNHNNNPTHNNLKTSQKVVFNLSRFSTLEDTEEFKYEENENNNDDDESDHLIFIPPNSASTHPIKFSISVSKLLEMKTTSSDSHSKINKISSNNNNTLRKLYQLTGTLCLRIWFRYTHTYIHSSDNNKKTIRLVSSPVTVILDKKL
eukprot:TRINITY_DN6568_c0_g1_i1.p1 TRINITY_DN6568_c0_g1~~TRINITY_DN6568_c0_g1_i1.p1  ORF type:complete len:254 (+),score=58.43 TRINITY_DN6568_c0_g1_i1:356-1117(+)